MRKSNKSGFTLAEVLITLTIIGVIAALTIPSLIVKHEKEETTARLKKVYSTLSQATQRSIVDNGPLNTWGQFNLGRVGARKFSEEYLMPYLKVMKNCEFDNTSNGCYYEYSSLNPNAEKYVLSNEGYHFYLNDGSLIVAYSYGTSINILADINGRKGPNISGKDVFYFIYILNSSDPMYSNIVPRGLGVSPVLLTTTTSYACNKNAQEHPGVYCAAKIMLDGWKIKDDYPW